MPHHTVHGASIYYQEHGKGTPLVLVHGFPLDSRVWGAQVSALADVCRVITVDLRGFGQSSGDGPFTMESLADDLHELLGAINARPYVLAGLSMGGYVALAQLTRCPTDLRGLILVDTRCEADSPEGKAGRMKMIEGLRGGGSKFVADAMMPKMTAPDAAQARPAVVKQLRDIMEACPAKTIEHALLAMRDRADHRDKLASIAVPTLIIVGEADAITSPAIAEGMAREIPHSKFVVVKGAGHMAPLEQPEQVSRAIREFIRGL